MNEHEIAKVKVVRSACVLVGFFLTLTGVGAIIGIPLMILGQFFIKVPPND